MDNSNQLTLIVAGVVIERSITGISSFQPKMEKNEKISNSFYIQNIY